MEYKDEGVWQHFMRQKGGQAAKCKLCNSKLKTVGGSTKGLHEHLKRVHDVTVLRRKAADESESSTPTTSKRAATGGIRRPVTLSDVYV